MAILGYIVYMIFTLFVSVTCLGVWSWAGTGKGEGISILCIAGLLWYGAYYFCPFSLVMT